MRLLPIGGTRQAELGRAFASEMHLISAFDQDPGALATQARYIRRPLRDDYRHVILPSCAWQLLLIMLGFLVQWPTLVTLAMFPILVTMYVQLSRREERDAEVEFGDEYRNYSAGVPAFFPHLSSSAPTHHGNG